MRVLWICGLPRGVMRAAGGLQSELSWVVGHLPPPDGVELHILCPVLGSRAYGCTSSHGATWHLCPLNRYEPVFLRRRFWLKTRGLVRKIAPDVIHGWGGETGWGLLATYFSRCAVVSVQGLLRMWKGDALGCRNGNWGAVAEWFQRRLEAATYRRAGLCLCESETAKGELKRRYGVESEVVPHPLRAEFCGSPVGEPFCELSRGPSFLFVGQDVARKGIDDLRTVQRRHPELDVTYITGGRSAAEIAAAMRTHDVFVLPSYGDTGPTAIKEALAMGMPVIAYDNTGPKELLEKYGGTLVKTGDVEALAEAMAHAEKQRNVASAERIRRDLARENVWRQLLEVYARVGRQDHGKCR